MAEDNAPLALSRAILAIEKDSFGQALFDWLQEACSFDNFAIVAYVQGQDPQILFTHARNTKVFERINSDYVNGAYLLDPFYALHKNNAPEGLYRLADIAPDQFQRNEYFKSYYAKTTATDELAFFTSPAPGVSITVCIGRDATTAKRFSTKEQVSARQIAPVVNALVQKNWSSLGPSFEEAPEDVASQLRGRLLSERGIALSPRQSEIALLILQGHSSISIGLTLGISPQTVKVIRKQLYRKCRISSQGELYHELAPFLKFRRQEPSSEKFSAGDR